MVVLPLPDGPPRTVIEVWVVKAASNVKPEGWRSEQANSRRITWRSPALPILAGGQGGAGQNDRRRN